MHHHHVWPYRPTKKMGINCMAIATHTRTHAVTSTEQTHAAMSFIESIRVIRVQQYCTVPIIEAIDNTVQYYVLVP